MDGDGVDMAGAGVGADVCGTGDVADGLDDFVVDLQSGAVGIGGFGVGGAGYGEVWE